MKRLLAFASGLPAPVLLSAALLLSACQPAPQHAAPNPQAAVEVAVLTLQPEAVSLNTELPGRVHAFSQAQIRPQVSGIILSRNFTEGAEVKAGDTLYQIDPALYQSSLNSAKAQLAKAEANLLQASAKASRFKSLRKNNLVSQQDTDEVIALEQQATADVLAAKASVEQAGLQLTYSKVLAPISGRIGKSAVTAGALVSAGQADALATITALDPVYVEITQSSKELLQLKQALAAGQLNAAGTQVSLKLEDGSLYPQQGQLQFSEVSVDESTGSVVLRAQFANPDQLLLPGMYVRATLNSGIKTAAILAPQRAVSRNAKGEATALVVNNESKAELRVLTTSRTIGDKWLIEEGLAAGDQLIVEGLQKVRPGAPVKAVPFNAAPAATEPSVKAADSNNGASL
ncbi:efflux RND transporter periplasmic adaptor subunit [Rheinheimera sp. 4Y26]|uniref:efflux RND transporter periplasmic adaptor subunit n=1 Tax=Rheinheimera sp. 4Y26 TaxID=2977811 RepID=UPI0021B10E99|nr:efflux RND transporter periplasmic adaptor subunit [Rheinheimera sp. 4Y26]MCT6698501.1 efflux RND transporter periplasmic adaptor subunit [Rheinheimera sp. 4Y26]